MSTALFVRASGALFALTAVMHGAAHAASPFNDHLVQPPQLAAPERGSVAGALAHLSFELGSMARGEFALPIPIAVPSERGAPLVNVLPSYAPDGGQSEWGMGWRIDLAIRRTAITGDLDFSGDELVSPWGRLVQSSDGNFRPIGVAPGTRLSRVGNGWEAINGAGTRFTFAAADQVGDGYAWMLSRVESVLGDVTVLSYERNASGRPFVSAIEWGGRGSERQYRIELGYETVPVAIEDYRAGTRLVLDRRVRDVRVKIRAAAGTFELRSSYRLEHTPSPRGAAFYLTAITQTHASGESEPTQRYSYDVGSQTIATAVLADVPALDPVLVAKGGSALLPSKATPVDIEDDGLTDFEIASDQSLVRQTASGFVLEPLPINPDGLALCRPPAASTNPPRVLARMALADAAPRVFRSITNGASGTSRVLVCDRQGVPQFDQVLPGEWGLGPTTHLVDLNNDRRPDLVRIFSRGYQIAENTSDEHGVAFIVRARGTLNEAFTPDSSWIQDMNGDGQADLVMRFPSSIAVWFGLGGFQFVPAVRSLVLKSASGTNVTDLAQRQLTFLDVNRDGLMDVVTTRGRLLALFINDGKQLNEVVVPGLLSMTWEFGAPVVADVTGSGNQEVMFVQGTRAKSIRLTTPSTGLLISADDGKGTVATFGYARSAPQVGAAQRSTVLDTLTLESSGYDPVTYRYGYGASIVHSVGKHLVGFASVDKRSPQLTERTTFFHDDEVSGVPGVSEVSDDRTPGILQFTQRQYDEVAQDDVRWLRPSRIEAGHRTPEGDVQLSTTTRYTIYERGFCPTVTTTSSPSGQLTTITALAAVAALPDDLHCTAGTQTLLGEHAGAALNFMYIAAIDHNGLGQVTGVTQVAGTGQALALQQIAYGAEHRVDSITTPGRGTTTYHHDAHGRLTEIIDSLGVAIKVDEFDPLNDAMLALRTSRPGADRTAFFQYDGRVRLQATWDDVSGGDAEHPLTAYAYQDATAVMPGRIDSVALADAAAGVTRHTTDLVGADGEAIATGTWLGDRASFGASTITSRTARTVRRSFIGTLSEAAMSSLTSADLRELGTPLAELTTAGFGHVVESTAVQQQGVVGTLTSELVLRDGELVTRVHEPGGFTYESALDAAGRMVRKVDQNGVIHRYAHDALGRLVRVDTPDGAHRLAFDAFGRPDRVTRDGIGAIRYAYSAQGLVSRKQRLDAAGALVDTRDLEYDAAGRLTRLGQTSANDVTTTAYDYDGRVDGATLTGQLGHLTRVRGEGWERSELFDASDRSYFQRLVLTGWRELTRDRVLRADGTAASETLTIRDAGGAVRHTQTEETELDSVGRISAFKINGAVLYVLSYDGEGRLARADFASGESIEFDHDPVTHNRRGYDVAAPNVTGGMRWDLDERGLITRETFQHGATTTQRDYRYDGRGVLTEAITPGNTTSYSYTASGLPETTGDTLGARTVGVRRPPGGATSQITVGDATYSWDSAGRVVGKAGWTFEYGASGQLEHARRPGREIDFVYDDADQRILKRVDGVPVRANVAGGVVTEDHFIQVVAIGDVVAGVLDNGQFTAMLADPRGTPFAGTDGQSSLASPYGVRTTRLGIAEVVDYARLGWDPDLDIIRMGVRDYDAALSQFFTPDPLYFEDLEKCQSSPLQCSLYSYAAGNPLNFVDPTGMDATPSPPQPPVWSPAPRVPPAPPPVAPPPAPRPPPASWLARVGGAVASVVTPAVAGATAGAAVTFWPREAGRGSTCEAPTACGKNQRRPKQIVNLDTGALINATQTTSPWAAAAMHAYLADKHRVVTQAAFDEFVDGLGKKASTTEKVIAVWFLLGTELVPNNPSARVMALTPDSKRSAEALGAVDKQVFGTGDQNGWVTVTTEYRFYNAARYRGVELKVEVFDPASHSGARR